MFALAVFRGERLRQLRESRDWSQEDLAGQLHVAYQQVQRWEKGRSDPSSLVIVNLANIFQVTADYLLGMSDVPDMTLKEADLDPDEQEIVRARRRGQLTDALRMFLNTPPNDAKH